MDSIAAGLQAGLEQAAVPCSPAAPSLAVRYEAVRNATERLVRGLSGEDQCIQSMPDASPAKWHRAHTTWFFETFVVQPAIPSYRPFDPAFAFLFNSYYEAIGERHPRPARGMITRPTADAVGDYRRHVDAAIIGWIDQAGPAARQMVALGLQHEQQHQELLVTDILHAFAQNPLMPAAIPGWQEPTPQPGSTQFIPLPEGLAAIGCDAAGGESDDGFVFDNETPRHRVQLAGCRLASHLVRNGEFGDFVRDGGYRTPTLWMSDGWEQVAREGWDAPFYWRDGGAGRQQMTPAGLRPLDPAAPLRHISWYEADAYARWAGARLPTEAEMETALTVPDLGIGELVGHVWQWTSSAYLPYPGFRAQPGAVGEYNGKFMINQMVLRGGSAATPPGHARPTYRNFFHPEKRWQFSGLRLALD